MWNKNKKYIDWLRERLIGEESKNIKPGMLTYLEDGTEINPQIVSLQNNTKKNVDENDIAEAIRTISDGTGIPVGELVLGIKRIQIKRIAQSMKNIAEGAEDASKSLEEISSLIKVFKDHKAYFDSKKMSHTHKLLESLMEQNQEEFNKNLQSLKLMQEAEKAFNEFDKETKRTAEYVLTKDMAERLKEHIRKPVKVYISKESIDITPTSIEVFRDKFFSLDSSTRINVSYTDIEEPYTGVELFRRHIEETNTYTISGSCCIQRRYEDQYEVANRNRHTSRHIPFYFNIFGQSRHVPRKNGRKGQTKFNRNVRPKGTHSHFKFYR